MAKGKRVNQKQFAMITARMHDELFVASTNPVPVDCVALLAYIEAAQAVYQQHCSIAQPMRAIKKRAIKKA